MDEVAEVAEAREAAGMAEAVEAEAEDVFNTRAASSDPAPPPLLTALTVLIAASTADVAARKEAEAAGVGSRAPAEGDEGSKEG